MSPNLAAQSLLEPNADTTARAVGISAFRHGAIERATDLGGGYLIVKIASPCVPVVSKIPQEISRSRAPDPHLQLPHPRAIF